MQRLMPLLGLSGGGGGGFLAGGPLGAAVGVGAVGASSVAKNLSRINRTNKANRAAAITRAGKGAQQQAAGQNLVEKRNALLRSGLVAEDANTAARTDQPPQAQWPYRQ
jgi:hypothetical protein